MNDEDSLSLVQFADDTVLINEGSWSEISGLKINFWKSCLFGIGVDVASLSAVASFINCITFSSKVVLSLIAIQRKFLWVGNNDKIGIVWISWDKLCLPKSKGGLGIKDLVYFNKVCYPSGCGGVSLKPIIFGMVYCYLEMAA
ncbi:hypothetical protein KIW84_012249 [Lathyrus oleraceus]|uniref:Uncharacterized protein n=1 Tax=Pisum sativum TaxID=3888 RepID=A0A9D5BH73_PEA|nr:hypothetical protein KIW84_012249 [Pisum sativum]